MSGISEVQENAARIQCPVLFLHGAEDTLAECGGSRLMHGKVSSADKELKIYEGAFHEVFNDTDRDRFMDDVTGWLEARA